MKKYFIGIDFSKKTFDATILKEYDDHNEELGYKQFDNNKKGYQNFYSWLRSVAPKSTKSQWLLCGETTGIYSEGLSQWAYYKGLDIWIENAYSIKHSLGLTRGKDDKLDSRRIATYAQEKKRKARLYKPLDGTLKELKVLLRRRQNLDSCRRAILNAVEEDKEAYGDDDAIKDIYDKIEVIAADIKDVENQIQQRMDTMARTSPELTKNYIIVRSAHGIGVINGIAFLVYTDNFRKFETANQMATAWGVAPFKKVSGTSIHTPGHVSFYCNHWLKALLTCGATRAIQYDDKIGNYYNRLIKEGKNKGVAYNNVKNKMIHIVFTMVKNQTMYDNNYDVNKKDKNVKGETKMLK